MFVTQQTHQRWNNVGRQRSSTLFHRWYLVENESWADVHLSTLFQCRQNNVEATSIELRWFIVDKPMLFKRWNLIEIESWVDVCSSMWFQRWQSNVETTLKELPQFNINDPMLFQRCIWLKMKFESMYVHRRCFNVGKTALKQLFQLLH